MLSEICHEINNWFCVKKLFGTIRIVDGKISETSDINDENGYPLPLLDDVIKDGQFYRIVGSVFNDGVYQHLDVGFVDETFNGAIWLMAVPPDFVALVKEISDWQEKYTEVVNSPFTSESFGGYSYTKASGNANDGSAMPSWKSVFAGRLNNYRRVRGIR